MNRDTDISTLRHATIIPPQMLGETWRSRRSTPVDFEAETVRMTAAEIREALQCS